MSDVTEKKTESTRCWGMELKFLKWKSASEEGETTATCIATTPDVITYEPGVLVS